MIGKKVPKSASKAARKSRAANIRHLTDYIAAPGTEEKVLYQAARNFGAESLPAQQQEMIALAERSARSKSPVSHYLLSWREGEQPTNEQAEHAVGILLEELGLEEHQAVYALHRDTDNIHVHVAVNRVHPDTQKVVRPNNNFDIEAVHRAVARVEHEQGWQSEANARYRVREDGEVVRRTRADTEAARQPGQRSRDYEQRTGAKSAERVAIEEAAPIFREARTWQDLHARLAAIGARLEQKGSGGLLWIDGHPVKPSAVDRQASFTALQKRLGPYEPLEEGQELLHDGERERDHDALRRAAAGGPAAGGATPEPASADLHGRRGAEPHAQGSRAPGAVAEPRDRLHDVSSRRMAENGRRAPVLLPGDVPRELEQGAANRDRGVRRRESRHGELTETHLSEALPVLRSARSWAEVHARLADLGIRYERKGSGAVVRSRDHLVKASTLDRSISLAALERRLGAYEPGGIVAPAGSSPAPAVGAVRSRPLRASPAEWRTYMEERTAHYQAKADAQAAQRRRHDEERKALREELRERRVKLLASAGSKTLRQALRSVIAAEHAGVRADARDRMMGERRELRAAHPRFPDLEEWLRARDPAAADRWRYRAAATAEPAAAPRQEDIRAFSAAVHGAHVHYHHRAAPQLPASFVDRGRAIHVHEVQHEAAVLASLQLAAQKWGRLHIDGDAAYKALCARLAAQHGFQLDNPELQADVQRHRASDRRSASAAPPAGADRRPPVHRVGARPPPDADGDGAARPRPPAQPAAAPGRGVHALPPNTGPDPRPPVHRVGARPPPEARGRLRSMQSDFHTPAAAAPAPRPTPAGRANDSRPPVHRVGTRPPLDAQGRVPERPVVAPPAPTATQSVVAGLGVSTGMSRGGAAAAARGASSTSEQTSGGRPMARPQGRALVEHIRAEFDRYHSAVQAERYRVTAIAMAADGSRKAFIVDKVDGVSTGFTPAELRARGRELARLAGRGENLYYTPLSASKHHLLVDDMNREKLERLVRDGFRPAAVLESSPGNYQAILTVPKLGSSFDREIGNKLSLVLNREYGDPNLSGAIHPHRAPGLENRKPKHQREDGSFPEVRLLRAEARECERALRMSRELLAERGAAAKRLAVPVAPARPCLPGAGVDAAYQIHYQDIAARFGHADVSRIDAMIALRLRATGHDREAIVDTVERSAPTIRPPEKRESHLWRDYAERTVQYAFGPGGDQQLHTTERHHAHWRRMEGQEPERRAPAKRAAPDLDGPDI